MSEVVILVGYPGSGKSTVYKHHYEPLGYAHVSGDAFKSIGKQIALCRTALCAGTSVVIDATNGSQERRQQFISIAREHGASALIVYVNVPIAIAMERSEQREAMTGKHIPKVAFYTYRKRFETPSTEECPVLEISDSASITDNLTSSLI